MSPKQALAGFLAKYEPQIGREAKAILATMRRRMPGANELVYDNYNALVIAFSANERVAGVVFSIAVYPRWVNLFFAHGAGLDDPEELLEGSGKAFRHIRLEDGATTLERPAVKRLMKQALAAAEPPIDAKAKAKILIKSVSKKQRPRAR